MYIKHCIYECQAVYISISECLQEIMYSDVDISNIWKIQG